MTGSVTRAGVGELGPTPTSANPVVPLDLPALLQLVSDSPEGISVIDERGTHLYVNPAGSELLGRSGAELNGTASLWSLPASDATPPGQEQVVTLGRRELSGLVTDVRVEGRRVGIVQFRDVTDNRQRERQLHTFAKAAASIAFSVDLSTLLDRLAEEVRQATGMYSCTFLLYDDDGELQQSGTAGEYPRVADYSRRLRECRELEAPLLADESLRIGKPIIAQGWRQRTLADPRFAPIHEFSRDAMWDTIVTVPLVVRERPAGVFNGFYLIDHEPHESDLPFLTAVADQAAVAVDNSQLLAAAERQAALEERHRLARELHDSVSQVLFSLSLQTRALEIALSDRGLGTEEILMGGVHEIRELSQDALVEMRALIFQLRPAALHEEGLVSSVRKHVSAVAARSGQEITISAPDRDIGLSPVVEEQLFRVVQEALHNVVKHAPDASVHVEIGTTGELDSDLTVEITDTGDGFDPDVAVPGHYGLATMTERVAEAGGELTVISRPAGTVVRAFLPGVAGPAPSPLSENDRKTTS